MLTSPLGVVKAIFFSLCILPITLWVKEILIKIIKALIKLKIRAEFGFLLIAVRILKTLSGVRILKARPRITKAKNIKRPY